VLVAEVILKIVLNYTASAADCQDASDVMVTTLTDHFFLTCQLDIHVGSIYY
jgi:hypothetical protein